MGHCNLALEASNFDSLQDNSKPVVLFDTAPAADIHGEVLVLPEEMRLDYCMYQLLEDSVTGGAL